MQIFSHFWRAAMTLVIAVSFASCGTADETTMMTEEPRLDAATAEYNAIEEVGESVEEIVSEVESEVEAETTSGNLGVIEQGIVLVGSELSYEPFSWQKDDEPVGFEIDLVNEIARRLELDVEYRSEPSETLITQLASGQIDVVISAVTVNDARDEVIDFTDPYYTVDLGLLITKESVVTSTVDLTETTTLGVLAGSSAAEYAATILTDVPTQEFSTRRETVNALLSGNVSAVLTDLPVATTIAQSDQIRVSEEIETIEEYAVAVKEGNVVLAESVNLALAEIISDGTYAELYQRWFDKEPPEQFHS